MRHAQQHFKCVHHAAAGGHFVELADEPHPAGVLVVGGVHQAPRLVPCGVVRHADNGQAISTARAPGPPLQGPTTSMEPLGKGLHLSHRKAQCCESYVKCMTMRQRMYSDTSSVGNTCIRMSIGRGTFNLGGPIVQVSVPAGCVSRAHLCVPESII